MWPWPRCWDGLSERYDSRLCRNADRPASFGVGNVLRATVTLGLGRRWVGWMLARMGLTKLMCDVYWLHPKLTGLTGEQGGWVRRVDPTYAGTKKRRQSWSCPSGDVDERSVMRFASDDGGGGHPGGLRIRR